MSPFLAGSAYSEYSLNIDGLKRNVAEAKALLRSLQADIDKLARTPAPGAGGGGGGGTRAPSADRQRAQAIRELEQAMVRQAAQERALLTGGQQVAQSEIRAATAARDYARALQLVDTQLDQAIPGTKRYNDLLAQQATLSRQAGQEAARSARQQRPAGGSSFLGSAQTAAGVLGIGLGARELVQQGIAAGSAALGLRRTENVLRELTGTQARYNQVIDLARENQLLFGGSLQENIAQLTGFAVAARRSGVEVATLNDLSKRLAILSPEQGAAGASIAINEALSGNASSLVRRFEIPKELLKGIEDSSLSAAQKLKILDDALTKSGVSAAAVKAAADPASQSYNELAASFETARLKVGELLAEGFIPAADAATRLLNAATGTKGGLGDLAGGASELNAQLGGILNPIAGVNQQLENSGISLREVNSQVGGVLNPLANLGDLTLNAAGYTGTFTEQLNQVGDSMGIAGQQSVSTAAAYDIYSNAARIAADRTRDLKAAQNTGIRPEDIGGGIPAVGTGKSNRQTVDQDAVDAFNARQTAAAKAATDAQRDQDYALASTAGRIKILRAELARLTPGTADYIKKQTELRQAENQLAAEQEAAANKRDKAALADEKRQSKEERALEAQQRKTDTALDTIENRYEDHYRKLAQLQDDYELSASRDEEDFQRQKQRLLAQGQRKEAELLEEEFRINQRRKQEDFQRQRSRENADVAADVARTTERAQIRGVQGLGGAESGATPPDLAGLPTGAPVTRAAGALPAGAGGGAGQLLVRVEVAPASIQIDGEQVALLTWPTTEQLVDASQAEALIRIGTVNPPNAGQNAGLGGGRP